MNEKMKAEEVTVKASGCGTNKDGGYLSSLE
jgi:hypothetical protein